MTATTPDAALLAAILHAPDDDAPRLIFADWLTENGQEEYGEFIAVQCELARFKRSIGAEHLPHAREEELRRRERELWEAGGIGGVMAAEFGSKVVYPQTAAPEWCCRFRAKEADFIVRRGFVEGIRCDLRTFVGGDECPRCEGTGYDYSHAARVHNDPDCPECSGSGRRPGLAGPLARACPVSRVVLSDREPISVSGNRLFGWINWSVDREFRMPHQIAPELYALLPDPPPDTMIGVPGLYPSAEAAREALSTAAVRYARDRAAR